MVFKSESCKLWFIEKHAHEAASKPFLSPTFILMFKLLRYSCLPLLELLPGFAVYCNRFFFYKKQGCPFWNLKKGCFIKKTPKHNRSNVRIADAAVVNIDIIKMYITSSLNLQKLM